MSPAVPASNLIPLPPPLLNRFSTHSSTSPFENLRRHLSFELGQPDLALHHILVPLNVFASVRQSTRWWARATGRTDALDDLCRPGVTAPLIDRGIKPGHAVVLSGPVSP
jgi:hypothetical protein